MIDKREILDLARRSSLLPNVVEKDYVLGWMLAGIAAQEELAQSWLFKGGTCLKKCFFETYRFSEDLDFTLTDPAHLDRDFLTATFEAVADWVYGETGIEVPHALIQFEIYDNPRGSRSCQGKISYRGPVSSSHGLPRIKLDLTADEHVVLPGVKARIFHPYSDEPDEGIHVLAYDYVEAFAEKFRALAERTRPRDLYDVVSLFRHHEARPAPDHFRAVLQEKCRFKGIALPQITDLDPHREALAAGWRSMLEHQLPALLPLEAFWAELPTIFEWLHGLVPEALPAGPSAGAAGPALRERVLPGLARGADVFIEAIRFAGANRLLIEIDYVDREGRPSTRQIEPYSFRRSQAGDIRLMAVQASDGQPRAFLISGLRAVRGTQLSFKPRFPIELTPTSLQPVPSSEAVWRHPHGTALRRDTRTGPQPANTLNTSRHSKGPTYVFRCVSCRREFSHSAFDATLKPHKAKSGHPCFSQVGAFVRTKF